MKYYAVVVGKQPGSHIYLDWPTCQANTKGVKKAKFKSFTTREAAEKYIAAHEQLQSNDRKRLASGNVSTMRNEKLFEKNSKRRRSEVMSRSFPSSPSSHARRELQSFDENADDVVMAFTDGACLGNGRAGAVAGAAVAVSAGHVPDVSMRVPGAQTNMRAELFAVALALNATIVEEKVLIVTDSRYVFDNLTDPTRLRTWLANQWKKSSGEVVKHCDVWRLIVDLLQHRKKQKLPAPMFRHVFSHVGLELNEVADKLASSACHKDEMQPSDFRFFWQVRATLNFNADKPHALTELV